MDLQKQECKPGWLVILNAVSFSSLLRMLYSFSTDTSVCYADSLTVCRKLLQGYICIFHSKCCAVAALQQTLVPSDMWLDCLRVPAIWDFQTLCLKKEGISVYVFPL